MVMILANVAARYDLPISALKSKHGPNRNYRTKAKQEAMYLMRMVQNDDGTPRYSYAQIAVCFGGYHHTSVMYNIRRYEKRVSHQWA
jgi:chromosomal replication initiation ATPase DnaA